MNPSYTIVVEHYFNHMEIITLRDFIFQLWNNILQSVFYTLLDHDPVVGLLGSLSFCCYKFCPVHRFQEVCFSYSLIQKSECASQSMAFCGHCPDVAVTTCLCSCTNLAEIFPFSPHSGYVSHWHPVRCYTCQAMQTKAKKNLPSPSE